MRLPNYLNDRLTKCTTLFSTFKLSVVLNFFTELFKQRLFGSKAVSLVNIRAKVPRCPKFELCKGIIAKIAAFAYKNSIFDILNIKEMKLAALVAKFSQLTTQNKIEINCADQHEHLIVYLPSNLWCLC